MSTASLLEVMAAIGDQLDGELAPVVEGIQVNSRRNRNPTPPTIDLYPGDPFGEQIAFDGREQILTVRARVADNDDTAAQDLLIALMDWKGDSSVIVALTSDRTFAGTVDDSTVEGPSGYIYYADSPGAVAGSLFGCEWRLRALL